MFRDTKGINLKGDIIFIDFSENRSKDNAKVASTGAIHEIVKAFGKKGIFTKQSLLVAQGGIEILGKLYFKELLYESEGIHVRIKYFDEA